MSASNGQDICMMNPLVNIQFHPEKTRGSGHTFCYRVAENKLCIDSEIPDLLGFKVTCFDECSLGELAPEIDKATDGRQLYQGPGWIGNKWREVVCTLYPSGYEIVVDGIGVFWISRDGENIVCAAKEETAGQNLLVEAALGPALILVLAMHGIYSLHASAVIIKNHVIGFLGESGKGKSTLARWLNGRWEGNGRRIGDDILPIAEAGNVVNIHPYFPQLKIQPNRQPSLGLPERLPLSAVYVLDRPLKGEGVEICPLGAQNGALNLVRHTVASRLFDSDILKRHLDFCIHTAANVPVQSLNYPFGEDALEKVQKALLKDLGLA